MGPRHKLLGQAAAVLVLYLGGIRIDKVVVLGMPIDFTFLSVPFSVADWRFTVAPAGLIVTLFWFLACMNVWNLIDGMDGLACGVGLLVSATLSLVAYHHGNPGVAFLAIALSGGLAGFLCHNWHPAKIFLGDTGSLLIGLLIGVIGVEGSLKGSSTISILFPILAMGLPISDTAMAIFRRWVRNLPLSSADRRHVHHLLIGLGLTTSQSALCLYGVTLGLCVVVLVGVYVQSEFLALVLGILGCSVFLLILTSRRDELATLRADFVGRFSRRRQERFAAKVAWEAIQRVELSRSLDGVWEILLGASRQLGCDGLRLDCRRGDRPVYENTVGPDPTGALFGLSGPTATFRLKSGEDLRLIVSLHQTATASTEADIAFRFLQRLALATAERIERLLAEEEEPRRTAEDESAALSDDDRWSGGLEVAPMIEPIATNAPSSLFAVSRPPRGTLDRLRSLFTGRAPAADPPRSFGDE